MVAGAPDADLLGLGRVCAVPTCGVRDFLPFTCSGCGAVTCVDHRTGPAHGCSAPQPGSERVLVCPVCAGAVRLPPGADPKDEAVANAAFDAHARSKACNPANYSRVHKKPSCPVSGCREKLGPSNTVTCKACATPTCLRHRHAGDHGCAARLAAARPSSAGDAIKRWFGCVGGTTGSHPRVSAREAAAAAAARRLAGQTKSTAPPPTTTTTARAAPGGGGGAAPACPVCARAFPSKRDLSDHHAAAHPGAPPLTRCVVA